MSSVVVAEGLTKTYGSRRVVDGLDLEVRSGEVFGLLGLNGVGKTTTIRMLLGLVRPTWGSVELFGTDIFRRPRSVLPRVGALIEAPALYGYMSGMANLLCFGDVLGGLPRDHVKAVLDLVGLRDRGRNRVSTYSLGMKQRLAVAVALLSDPELVVLDEPANGLDPAGIVETRGILRSLAAAGKAVLVSSHVLAEVEESCDRIGILHNGRLAAVGRVAELTGDSGEFEVRVDGGVEEVLRVLHGQAWGAGARIEGGLVVTPSPTGHGRDLFQFLAAAGHVPDSIQQRVRKLEDIFLRLTGGAN